MTLSVSVNLKVSHVTCFGLNGYHIKSTDQGTKVTVSHVENSV